MREIKYQAWLKEHQKIIEVRRIIFNEKGASAISEWEAGERSWWYLEPHFILREFINLHDRNGTEIWEGDIYKNRHITGQIVFHEASFQLKYWKTAFVSIATINKHWNGGEVIGNIYENPELLEATNV